MESQVRNSTGNLSEWYGRSIVTPATLVIVISLIGGIGNLWFALVLSMTKALNKPNYRLLLGVVINDFIVDLIFIPVETLQIIAFHHKGMLLVGELFCKIEVPAYKVAAYGSIIGQFLVAINRGVAVFLPITYRNCMTNRSVSILFVSTATLLPFVFFFGQFEWSIDYTIDYSQGDCDYKFRYSEAFLFFDVLFNYIPIFGSLLIYTGIVFKILLTRGSNRVEVVRRARGSMVMLLCMVILAVAFLAGPITRAFDLDKKDPLLTFWFKMFYRISYGINPVREIYSIVLRRLLE